MDPELKANLNVSLVSFLGFIFSFLSPIRDPIANYTVVLGFLFTTILLVSNTLFKAFNIFRRYHPLYFSIKIINILLTMIIIIGVLFGHLVGIWSPFWFLPFGYYIFLSATVTYIIFYDLNQLFTLYQQTQFGRKLSDSELQNKFYSEPGSTVNCECGRKIDSEFIFCPFCGRVLRKS